MFKSPYLTPQHALSQQGFPHGVPGWYGSRIDISSRRPVALQDQYWRRFLEIYYEICGTLEAILPSLILRTEQSFNASDEETALANELFVQELSNVARSKSLWRSQKKPDGKGYIIATAALSRLVQEGGSPGVAQCLVRKGGTITLSKDPQKQTKQISQRHDLIRLAASLGRTSLVDYLATISPPERIADALAISVQTDNVELTKTLLEHGASPDSLFQAVPDHFKTISSAMLELLLQSPTPPSSSCRDRWLRSAVAAARLDLAVMLLRYGASPGLDYLDVLRKAIEELHLQAFLVTLKCMHSTGIMHFHGLLQQIVKCPDMSFADKMLAMEATLCVANSKDALAFRQRLRISFLLHQDASEALQICASSGQIGLVELLRQPRFDTEICANTLMSAISSCDLHLLDYLYPESSARNPPKGFLLTALPFTEDCTLRKRLLLRLLELQVQGPYLDVELVLAVKGQNSTLVRSLINAGANVDYNGGEALILAVDARIVPLVRELLRHSTKPVRNNIFVRLRATEMLPRRLMTKLFVEEGLSRAVLHYALRDAVCNAAPFRDVMLIDILVKAGADYRMIEAPFLHALVDQGDFQSIADLLNRMIRSTTSCPAMPAFVSQLLERLVHSPTKLDDSVRHQMMKLFVSYKAVGDCVLLAFEEFITSKYSADEDLLYLFLSPVPANRTTSYNAVVTRVLSSVDLWILYRLIHKIELYEDILKSVLESAAYNALRDDIGTANRLQCLLTRIEPKNPALEKGLDFHIRTYAAQCSDTHNWPLKTIDALISKGFAGTVWLTHALMATTEAANAEVLSILLNSAGQICTHDIVDSVLLLAVQQNAGHSPRIINVLLSFGVSQDGLDMALLMASETDDVQVSALLLKHGADLNYRSGECLMTALRQNRLSILECLLAQGNAKELSLKGAWTFITGPLCELSTTCKAEYCRSLLRAGFCGPQVQEFLFHSVASTVPDYEMITIILDESEALKQERKLRYSCNGTFAPQNSSQCEEPTILLAILARAIASADGRLCRLVLTYLPANCHIPTDLLKVATSTSTAILALILNHIPLADRQETLNICLVHAASVAADSGTCIYLLCEGASCEALSYTAISAATKRALKHNASDRAPLEALLNSSPGQEALRAAWYIAVASLESNDEKAFPDFSHLRTIKVLKLILSAGLQNLEALQSCMYTLCKRSRVRASKCETCARDDFPCAYASSVIDCCPSRRIQAKTEMLVRSLLDRGLAAQYNNGESIIAATQNHQYEVLEILLSTTSPTPIDSSILGCLIRPGDARVLYDTSSQTLLQMQARLKTLRILLKLGLTCPDLPDALRSAVQNSIANVEARRIAELLLEYRVHDQSGAVVRYLSANPQPEIRHLLSLALELEVSQDVRLEAVERLVSSDLDEDSMSSLILSAMCGSTSQLLEMTPEETQKILRATAEAGKVEALTLILSCIPQKSVLSPFYSSSCFVVWLLRSCTTLAEHFLAAVLEWLGPEEVQKMNDLNSSLCLVQEAVLGRKTDLIPLLVSSGANTVTKAGESLLYDTIKNTDGESPDVLKAILSLCNDSTLNDGSLQLAVENMREGVVNLLLDNGHDPNFGIPLGTSSVDHALPLNMLCATASVLAHESDCGFSFKRIMIKLMMHGARIGGRMCGRSALFNALDNPRCTLGLLRNVIDCFYLSDNLEQLVKDTLPDRACSNPSKVEDADDTQSFKTAPSTRSISDKLARTSFFEVEDATHHYSASMYLKKDIPCPPYFKQPHFSAQQKAALLEFLRSQDLPDIYYALEGPQPEDAIGVPIELLLGSAGCAVCGDSVSHIDEAFGNLTEACTHNWTVFMCKECLDGYMTSKVTVENGAVNSNVPCWAEGCSNMLSHYDIKRFANPELFEIYDHALLQQTIHEGETFAECSSQGCKGGGWLDSENVSYFECGLCHQETCVSHNGPRKDHAGKPCPATPEGQRYAEEEAREEAERQAALVAKNKAEQEAKKKAKAEADRLAKERKEGLKATEALMKKISKKCPTCKVPIEKRYEHSNSQ